jgi:hypothetical protein
MTAGTVLATVGLHTISSRLMFRLMNKAPGSNGAADARGAKNIARLAPFGWKSEIGKLSAADGIAGEHKAEETQKDTGQARRRYPRGISARDRHCDYCIAAVVAVAGL